MMTKRIPYDQIAPDGLHIMMNMEAYTKTSGINRTTRELMKIRASQLNGCAYCINIHTKDARKMGETEQRIYGLNAWEECSFYTPEEKAALLLTEHVTFISNKRMPDDVYQEVRKFYNEKEYVDLILIINQINNWNRIAISMGNIAE